MTTSATPPPAPRSPEKQPAPSRPEAPANQNHHQKQPQLQPRHHHHAIKALHTYLEPIPYACGHTKHVPLSFFGAALARELSAARNRAEAEYRYFLCRECRDPAGFGFLFEQEVAEELGRAGERMRGEKQGREAGVEGNAKGGGVDPYEVLAGFLPRILALRLARPEGEGEGARSGGAREVAEPLMDFWARLAVEHLAPEARGKLLFSVRMENGDKSVQWVAERMAYVTNKASAR